MRFRFEYNGGSFTAGAICAMVYYQTISPWWLLLALVMLLSIGPFLQWKNDGEGWRFNRAALRDAEEGGE